jgi:DNA-binding SARP family transcriptional activator
MHDLHQSRSGIPSSPFVRIWLCGPMTIEWVDPYTRLPLAEQPGVVQNKDWSVALSLLALLLCQPHRRASRDWIMEQFWPESTSSTASHRLETIHSSLSKLLPRQADGESLLHSIGRKKASGVVYQLDAYPKIWVDRDAILWNVEQAARMERFGDDPLPYWERAFELSKRGPFLMDEPYADWAQGPRTQVEGAYRQCVHALARLYPQQYSEAGKEEALHLLRSYWLEHKIDEDALRPLMALLGEQERYQEAEDYYQQLLSILTEPEQEDGEHSQEPDPRTRDLRIFLQEKQIQREYQQVKGYTGYNKSEEDRPEHPLQSLFVSDMSRREANKKIITAGVSLLFPAHLSTFLHEGNLLHEQEILSIGAAVLPILWRLYFDGHLPDVQLYVPDALSQLAILARQPSRYQQQAALLSSKMHQLSCMLALQSQDYGLALLHTEHAQELALVAGDPNVLVASCIRKALVYRYINRYLRPCPKQIMDAYQEAISSSQGVSSLLQGRLFTGLAEVYSEDGQADEAKRAIERAYTIFPDCPQDDPQFSYTHFKLPQKFEAIMYLNLREGKKAWDLLAAVEAVVPVATVPDRVELFLDQTRAVLLLGDLDACCTYLQASVKAAAELGSQLRYHEAYSIYTQIHHRWPQEQKVLKSAHLFHS